MFKDCTHVEESECYFNTFWSGINNVVHLKRIQDIELLCKKIIQRCRQHVDKYLRIT